MSVLAATIADAQRPLPGRRGSVMVQRAAFEEPEPEMADRSDAAALTVYRLQKDGANPIAPVAPASGSTAISRGGPSAGVEHALDVRDSGTAANHVARRGVPFVEGQNESNVRESRFASTEARVPNAWSPSIPPPPRVGSPPAQTASSVSLLSDVDSQSEASGQTDQRDGRRRVARSAPSETSDDAQAVHPAARDVAPARRLTDAVAGRAHAAAMAARVAAERAERAETGVHAGVPPFADAVIESTPGATRALREAGVSELPSPHAAPPRAVTAPASDGGAPRVHIGRIDVTVLADTPAAAAGARGGADDGDRHFSSRHYLRRP